MGAQGLAGEAVVRPCGRCRQVLKEAAQVGGRRSAGLLRRAGRIAIERHLLSALLPLAFGPDDLG